MTQLTDLLAAQVALVPVADRVAPTALGYGTDLSCVTDITADAAEVDPMSMLAISQAIVRRFISPRTSVLDDGSYGLDLRGRLNAGMSTQEIARLRSQCRVECLKDDRVSDADITLTFAASRLSVTMMLTPHDSDDAFSLTFFVTADGVQLQESINQHG